MRVLDIDLDFFLADCCEPAPAGARPDAAGHEPWQGGEGRKFFGKKLRTEYGKKDSGKGF